ncbi:TonB-dependent receptor plug domain-containing protein [Sphingomonas sp.]|uniref:TonB-dependent receptor plug domain-containing protein n=1 Tax=Sphingomonas sp. TaxID=28214 RepID=UPI003B3ABC17
MHIGLILALAVQAAPVAPQDDLIVITGSRLTGPIEPPALSLRDIELRQPVSLEAALNDVAGVRAFTTGGDAGGSFVSVRGGEPNFTLVLIEGLRLNNPTNSRGGAFDFLTIDPQAIDHVEIFRSAASAIHGSDALAGVIDLRLRISQRQGFALAPRGFADTQGAVSGGASLDTGWHSGGLFVDASHLSDDNLSDGARIERSQALAHVTQQLGSFALRGVGLFGHSQFERFPEDSGGPRLAVSRALEHGTQRLAAAGFTLRRTIGAPLRPGLAVSYSDQRDTSNMPAIAPGVLDGTPALRDDSHFRRLEVTADMNVHAGPLEADVGGALRDEHGRSAGTLMIGFPLPVAFTQQRATWSLFGEARLEPASWLRFDGGGRHDMVEHGTSSTTGFGGAAVRPVADGPWLSGRVGQGYKLPSFYALSHPLVGNPILRPERSVSKEAAIEQPLRQGSLRAAYFNNRYRDLIDFDAATFGLVNRDRVRARGFEVEAKYMPLPILAVSAALTHTRLASAEPLRGRPRWQGNVHATWQAGPRLEIDAIVRANSSLFDSSVPTGMVTVAGHGELDLGVRYRINRVVVASVTARNLTGTHYEDAVGFPAKRQLVRFAFRAGFD